MLIQATATAIPLRAASVHTVMTSPPYWGLRNYKLPPLVWGGDPGCQHEWKTKSRYWDNRHASAIAAGLERKGHLGGNADARKGGISADTCLSCSAWRGSLGLEPTPEQYIAHIVGIGREIGRVLRTDGVWWLNLSDSHSSGGRQGHETRVGYKQRTNRGMAGTDDPPRPSNPQGIEADELVGIPHRVALALRADGWKWRQTFHWLKENPMPECLDVDTQIFIRRDGWASRVTIGDLLKLKALPEILTPSGWKWVGRVWKTRKTSMTLSVGKVERVICSPDHRFPVSHDRRRRSTELKQAKDIRHVGHRDYLLYKPIEHGCTTRLPSFGRFQLDYEAGFVVGVYAAEGNDSQKSNQITLSIGAHEKGFAKQIRQVLNGLQIQYRADVERDVVLRFRAYSKELHDLLRCFIWGQAKTKSLNISLLLNTPCGFRQGILDGYVKGDGSKRGDRGWIIGSASRALRDDICTLASTLGIVTSRGQQKSKGSRLVLVESVIHTAWTPYLTKRKQKNGADGCYQLPPRRRELTRQAALVREMVDIEVEGGVFLIGDGLVCHNSVNGWRWERHLVKIGRKAVDWKSMPKGWESGEGSHDTVPHGNYRHVSEDGTVPVWAECKGCHRCTPNGGLVLRGGSWRHTSAVEYVFMLTRGKYWSNGAVVREEAMPSSLARIGQRTFDTQHGGDKDYGKTGINPSASIRPAVENFANNPGRNPRNWQAPDNYQRITSEPYAGAHYATFGSSWIAPMIKASCPRLACPRCGQGWAPVVDRSEPINRPDNPNPVRPYTAESGHTHGTGATTLHKIVPTTIRGYRQTCRCDAAGKPVPGVVLDPFCGSGTVGEVCEEQNLLFVGLDLSMPYLRDQAMVRVEHRAVDTKTEDLPLFAALQPVVPPEGPEIS